MIASGKSISDTANARQLISDYSASLGGRNSTKAGQTSSRESVAKMFAQADFILEHQIDMEMRSFKTTHPDFSNAYDAARIIKDVAAHHKGKGNNGNAGSPKPPDSKQ